MTLKIGFVTGEYPPMQGGVGAFTDALARAVASLGHEVHIITSNKARPVDLAPPPAPGLMAALRRLDNVREPIDLGYAQLHPRARRWHWRDVGVVADIAIRYDLDVVNIQYQAAAYNMRHPAVNLLPWRLRGLTRRIVTFHDLRTPYLLPKAGRIRRGVVNMMAREADGVIATNDADYRELTGRLSTPVRQIPIGSNIAAQPVTPDQVTAARAEFGLPEAGYTLFGYFGFLNATKGADILLQALAGLDDRHHLLFIGGRTGASDPQNNAAFLTELETLIARLGLVNRVHWTDFVPEEKVSVYLAAADVLVMPYRDGVSLRRGTLMAALAHGRPLISTEPPTPNQTFRHGENVWLTPPGDAAALAAAMSELANRPALRAQLGQGAVELAGHFTWDKIAAATLAFYGEIDGRSA